MSEYIDPSKRDEFKKLQIEGKYLASVGDLEKSLQKFELAKKICPTPKVLQRIEKLKECLRTVNVHCGEDESASHTSSNLSSTEVNTKVSPALNSTTQNTLRELQNCTNANTFVEPKVLGDIQNIQHHQKSSAKISEFADLSPESEVKFKKLKKEAKEFAYDGKYDDAVNSFRKALSICDCPNVKKYIKKIEEIISNNEVKRPEDQSIEKKLQHTSESVIQESLENNAASVLSSNAEEVKNFKDQFTEKKFSAESVQESQQEKSSPIHSEEANESDVERKLAEVKILYEEARDLAADGQLTDALKILKKAQSIHATQKVQKRIDKLEELISTDANDAEENKMIEIANGLSVFHEIYNKLYPYQREGVAWMWKLYSMGKGGVLGDDMGLGKTFQIIAFISGMIDADRVKHVLIIMPVSLLKNWEREFKKWCPGIAVHDFHSGSRKERERNLLRVQRRGHVLLTSYGMVVNNVDVLTVMDDREFVWDYVILDEGHKIKNPTKTTKAVYEIPAKNRLVLTGTPIQNNLKELWSLYDFVHQGTLLGSLKTFKLQYENPITRSREKDATAGEKRLGSEMAENLKALIRPYFLRRTKEEIWKNNDKDVNQLEKQMENLQISQVTAKKNDLILWTYMSESQIAIYKDFLHSEAVKAILVSKRSPLVELTTLKKICDHPRLLSQRACIHLGLNGELQKEDLLDLDDESTLASSINNVTDECLLKESGKLNLVIDLLENLKETGHRTLVFSLSRKILDMIHRILTNKKWKVMRLDGTITKTEERERRIQKFQRDNSYPVFLLTTQVGGVGITLTAADRVIIYDPSWNPATDAQAVDRVYRIGQQKDVVVYRLITCGTVEEKIYRRQIFKDSITRQATGVADPYRYFSKQELRELFSLENPRYSATQVQLHEMHSSQRRTYDELENHMTFLKSLDIFGISDHDLMFTKEIQDHSEDNDDGAISDHFIKQKVAAAHELIKMEASVVAEGIRLAGTYSRPYQEAIPLTKKGTRDTYKPPVLPDVIDLTEDAQDNIFSLSAQKKSSLTSTNTSDIDIQMHTPKEENEGVLLAKEQYSSQINKIRKDIDAINNKHSFTTSPLKNLNSFPLKEISSDSENALDEVVKSEKFERSIEVNPFSKVEKLRKSSFKPTVQEERVESPNRDKEMNLSVTRIKDISIGSDDENVPKVSTELNPLDVQEKFQANLTHLMNQDFANFSFDEEAPVLSVKKGRKSCARQSSIYISESDTSHPNSASNSNVSIKLADESDEDTASELEDSSNSASLSFVPDSVPNTPQMHKHSKAHESIHESVCETPSRSLRFEPELLSGKNSVTSDTSILKKFEGSIGRIVPLKVDRSLTQEDSSFVQAMATSLIITPEPSPDKSKNIPVKSTSYSTARVSDDDDEDSPLKVRKKKVRQVCSDSEESEKDTDSEDEEVYSHHPSVKYQVKQSDPGHLESLSDDVDEGSPLKVRGKKIRQVCSDSEESEKDTDSEDKEVYSDHPSVKCQGKQSGHGHLKSSSHEEEETHSTNDHSEDNSASDLDNKEVQSDHSITEYSLEKTNLDSESDDKSDLERTFATCKEKPDSNSEEYSDSAESGSVFSEDD